MLEFINNKIKNLSVFNLVLVFSMVLAGCGGGGENPTNTQPPSGQTQSIINGKAQKGPFLKGATVVATHLNALGIKDNQSVSTTVANDLGNYTLKPNWQGWTELTITGRFYDEDAGANNPTELSLISISKLSSTNTNQINVNLFTHFIAARVKNLVNQNNNSLEQAKKVAQDDLRKALQFLNTDINVEKLDLSNGSGDLKNDNAILLLFSGSFMTSDGSATLLLALTDDFAGNGKFNGDNIDVIGNHAGVDANFDKFVNNLKRKGIQNPPDRSDLISFPKWVNLAPVANILPTFKTITEGETIVLNGSDSNDPDGDQSSLRFIWAGEGTDRCGNSPQCSLRNLSIGEHKIILGVTDEKGSSHSSVALITVRSVATVDNNSIPIARLSVSDDEVTLGENVTFDATRSSDDDGDRLTFSWFGLGTQGCANSAKCTVNGVGSSTFTVTVLVKDGNGGSDSAQRTVRVSRNNLPPFAYAGLDKTIIVGTDITLSADASYDPDGTIVSYQWKKSGNHLSNSKFLILNGLSAGTRVYELTVTDNDGAIDTDTVTLVVRELSENKAPNANAGPNQTVTEGNTIILSGSASNDQDGTIVSYQWTKGGNNLSNSETLVLNGLSAGTRVYELTVTDNNGATDTDTVTLVVRAEVSGNQSPNANAGPNKTIIEGDTLFISGSASNDPDGNIVNYEWKLEEVIVSRIVQLTQSDVSVGTYTYKLTVTDNDGATNSDTVTIVVREDITANLPPRVIAGEDRTISEGTEITLTASALDVDGEIASYEWKKGASVIGRSLELNLSGLSIGSHTYTFTATDNEGASASDDVIIHVEFITVDTPTAQQCTYQFGQYYLATYSFNGNVTGTGTITLQAYTGINCTGVPNGEPAAEDKPLTYSLINIVKDDSGSSVADMTITALGLTRNRRVNISSEGVVSF